MKIISSEPNPDGKAVIEITAKEFDKIHDIILAARQVFDDLEPMLVRMERDEIDEFYVKMCDTYVSAFGSPKS